MEMTLTQNQYGFGANPDLVAIVRVISGGPLQFTSQIRGPFSPEGEIARGESQQFSGPTIVSAGVTTRFDISYPQPDVSPLGEPANGEVEAEAVTETEAEADEDAEEVS